jgi:hypothetical protein
VTTPETNFTLEYAIRLPDGGYARHPHTGEVLKWAAEDDALKSLEIVRGRAAQIGVTDWAGVVVRRYCTPFIGPDEEYATKHLVDELSEWLKQQTGEQK